MVEIMKSYVAYETTIWLFVTRDVICPIRSQDSLIINSFGKNEYLFFFLNGVRHQWLMLFCISFPLTWHLVWALKPVFWCLKASGYTTAEANTCFFVAS